MAEPKTPNDATLLDVLVDGFEKNEVIHGFHYRQLPMSNERAALAKFSSLTDEARHWKGPPTREEETPGRRLAAWPDLEIRLAGHGLMVRARMTRFSDWWHDKRTWQGDPLGPVWEWIAESPHS